MVGRQVGKLVGRNEMRVQGEKSFRRGMLSSLAHTLSVEECDRWIVFCCYLKVTKSRAPKPHTSVAGLNPVCCKPLYLIVLALGGM